MRIHSYFLLFVAFLILVSNMVQAYSNVLGTCYCTSCSDCSNALNDASCNTISISNDISDSSYCIMSSKYLVGKTIDCNGHTVEAYKFFFFPGSDAIKLVGGGSNLQIENCKIVSENRGIYLSDFTDLSIIDLNLNGSDSAFSTSYNSPGISLYRTSNVKIERVNVSRFEEAVKLYRSHHNSISNLSATGISRYGVLASYSSDINITSLYQLGVKWNNCNGGYIKSVYVTTPLSQAIYFSYVGNVTIEDLYSFNSTVNGLDLRSVDNITMSNVTVDNSPTYGIKIDTANYLDLSDIYIQNSTWACLRLDDVDSFSLTDSQFSNCDKGGVYVGDSNNGVISSIVSAYNSGSGIYIDNSHNVSVSSSTLYSNIGSDVAGIFIKDDSSGSFARSLTVENNTVGALFYQASNFELYSSLFKMNQIGVEFATSDGNNTFRHNRILYSVDVGASLDSSSQPSPYDRVYDNYFNNSYNVRWKGTEYETYWNTTLHSGSNVMFSSLIGGNFWGKPDGTGFSDTCIDNDKNGICDSPYPLNTSNIDYYPLSTYRVLTYMYGCLDYVPPTPDNDTILYNQTYLPINVTNSSEYNFSLVSITLYNYSTLNTTYQCITTPCFNNFTGLEDGVYYVLAEMYLDNGTICRTEVRTYGLSNTPASFYCDLYN